MPYSALVIGAGSQIAQSIIDQLDNTPDCADIIAISREQSFSSEKVHYQFCDNSEAQITQVVQGLTPQHPIRKVFICQGLLHHDTLQPERRLEDIQEQNLMTIFHTNTVIPTLWLTHLLPTLSTTELIQVVVFSARVGSISDNHLGGWYSYRASKAALNMMLQTFSIECARRMKQVKLIAFHPGTTDTPLSKPFQRSVPKDKLFTPEFVAKQLLSILENTPTDGKVSYIDWENKPIPW